MHTTTARFDDETWQRLIAASRRAGVSKAQYIRDATFMRMAGAVYLPELIDLRRDVDYVKALLEGRRR